MTTTKQKISMLAMRHHAFMTSTFSAMSDAGRILASSRGGPMSYIMPITMAAASGMMEQKINSVGEADCGLVGMGLSDEVKHVLACELKSRGAKVWTSRHGWRGVYAQYDLDGASYVTLTDKRDGKCQEVFRYETQRIVPGIDALSSLRIFATEAGNVGISKVTQSFDAGDRLLLAPELDPYVESNTGVGLLLWGRPGTGKTSGACGYLKSRNLHFISIESLTPKSLQAASELQRLFDIKAILFDDIETAGQSPGMRSFVDRMIDSGALVIATSNNPDEIDQALLRAGRIEKHKRIDTDGLTRAEVKSIRIARGLQGSDAADLLEASFKARRPWSEL